MGLVFRLEKENTKEEVILEVSSQLKLFKDVKLVDKVSRFLVEPSLHFAIWDYGEPEDKYPVWLIIGSEVDDTGILYSEYGFDFGNWGLIKLSDRPFHFGMDSQWYPTLEGAFLDSWMAE